MLFKSDTLFVYGTKKFAFSFVLDIEIYYLCPRNVLNIMKRIVFFLCLSACSSVVALGGVRTFKIKSRYLNIPISGKVDRRQLTFSAKGMDTLRVVARIADVSPDYWVFKDVSAYKGKTLTLNYDGSQQALDNIQESDTIVGQTSMYKEENRPQFHFTTRRGWINDPNGLVYHKGLYHLYYQHNPYEREWENMTWGHATSPDLLHWTEHDDVLFPDRLGTMFSGSAVYDEQNTSGFGSSKNPPIVYAYTADRSDREVQCIAYSLDGGYTLHKFDGNPVVDSHDKWNTHDTRDPRLFWYAPGKHWVMVLNERDGHSIYNSKDLREWTYQSHVRGFWECPDLFELPVDGDPSNTRWVMYGASNTYMIGSFDGKTFVPEGGKYSFTSGTIYAAQTFSNIPASDGRRIQIGWGRIAHPGMPFNGMMLLPTELRLRTTVDGIRMTSVPVREVESLLKEVYTAKGAQRTDEANTACRRFDSLDGLHLHCTLQLSYSTSAGISLNGQSLVDYDCNQNTINGRFYSPQDPTQLSITVDVYVDRTSVEVFVDDGLYSYSLERKHDGNSRGLEFWGNEATVSNLKIDAVQSVWH